MDKNKFRSKITDTIIEVISDLIVREVEKRIKIKNNRILVVYSGGAYGFRESVKSIKYIIKEGYEVKVVITESANNVLGAENIKRLLNIDRIYIDGKDNNIMKFIDESELLILPSLTINSVAKIANCISDTYLTRAASNFILKDKKIFASKNSCCPNDKERLYYSMNPSNSFYKKKMIENMDMAEKFGVIFSEAKDLHTFFIKNEKKEINNMKNSYFFDKKVITKSDVAKLEKGSTLITKNKSILTDLAKDHIRTNGIDIKSES